MKYDLAIIGAGPAGYTVAETAAKKGLKTLLFEKDKLGGVCLNEGCIPTKTLLYSAKILDLMKNASKYGLKLTGGEAAFDLDKMMTRKTKTLRKLAAGIKTRLADSGVVWVTGEAHIAGESDGTIEVVCGSESYRTDYLLLCTGSEALVPPIKGLEAVDSWTSKEALNCDSLPERISIIGGGVIGLEFASLFNSLGVKVQVIEMQTEILPGLDRELASLLRKEYEKKSVVFHTGTRVLEALPDNSLIVERAGESLVIEADRLLVCVGRRPFTSGLGLEKLGLEGSGGALPVDKHMRTKHPRVYAAGDITGHSMLAHTAIREAAVALNHILGINDTMSYAALPAVVYTNPELASVGKSEEELVAASVAYRVVQLPMTYSGRFVAENEGVNGLCKLLLDKDNHILGCHMLGNPASELIPLAALAIGRSYSPDLFRGLVFPHPSVSEIFHELGLH